jgi:hypothetical protein
MTPFTANPFMYVFSGIALAAVFLYFGYAAIDRWGLETRSAVATITAKQNNPSGSSFYTNIVGGRAWTQSQETPETHALTLKVDDEITVGLVSKPMFDTLQLNDKVNVIVRRTRITRRLEVVEVAR